ncbi:GTP pyrophosphokinase [Paenibacillus sp. ISL-20]|uniref:GTP pyrophosphokinase n=1 Tax=Paenibacillus sp. ISL-20 TaxID=2819163 RepID=UPI001BE6AB90|nr:GTP pyrophosphokinase [Paenibacillus sp. ISL-20]MBT2759944.1 bifunctional (p)ppGpp synthetase/guanosine-3',5'-bis(diphosphate) 3'-pyrophosphohydrolase [Paenibacillus sp. ISL-20]
MNQLEKAIVLATTAHQGQSDKGGHPYILHPLRVMMKMKSEEERIVAVLHDVIEDSGELIDDLVCEGYSTEVCKAIHALTRQKNESYMEFIERCKQNPLASNVKIQDLSDNLDMSRIKNPTKHDYDRQKKYTKALRFLLA